VSLSIGCTLPYWSLVVSMYATFGEHDHLYYSYKARQTTFID